MKYTFYAICSQVKRYTNLIARYGGEEFAVILPNIQLIEVIRIVEDIRQELFALNIPHENSSVAEYVTLSFGIAYVVPTNETEPQLLVDRADQALYKVKANGRNSYSIYG
jgi:two-component system, cell cycle response regulator